MSKMFLLLITATLALPLAYNSCSPLLITKTGNPLSLLPDPDKEDPPPPPDTVGANEAMVKISGFISDIRIKMCFKRMRFESVDGGTDVEFKLIEKELDPAGTDLQMIRLPQGQYNRIRLDLDDDCPGEESVAIDTGSNTYSTNDHIEIEFRGLFNSSEASSTLEIGMQKIIDKLKTVKSDRQIKSRLESVSGSF